MEGKKQKGGAGGSKGKSQTILLPCFHCESKQVAVFISIFCIRPFQLPRGPRTKYCRWTQNCSLSAYWRHGEVVMLTLLWTLWPVRNSTNPEALKIADLCDAALGYWCSGLPNPSHNLSFFFPPQGLSGPTKIISWALIMYPARSKSH